MQGKQYATQHFVRNLRINLSIVSVLFKKNLAKALREGKRGLTRYERVVDRSTGRSFLSRTS